jgi:hypothetical protein
MFFITEDERDRIDAAHKELDEICKKHRVEILANDNMEFWFECVEYVEPVKQDNRLKVVK